LHVNEGDHAGLAAAHPAAHGSSPGSGRGCAVAQGAFGQRRPARIAFFAIGAAVLFAYGIFVNLAPLEFGQLIGLYIATLFVTWQLINFVFFHTPPTLPILVGGTLIVTGGLIVSFWKTT
jgi:small multidrug resistance family-3 protein